MGRDKAQLAFGATTLLEHALETLRGLGFEAAVAGLRSLTTCSAPVIVDAVPDAGPLSGIEAALRSLAAEPPQPVLFLAVDLPLLSATFLSVLWERAQTTGALATVPYLGGRPQPLCAVYNTSLAPAIACAINAGDRKVMQVLRQVAPAAQFDAFRVEALAPMQAGAHWSLDAQRWFTNVNTPEDWQALQIEAQTGAVDERQAGAQTGIQTQLPA